ncbi:RDD family protein [Spirillospora sp. CA-255316]
MNPHFPPAYAPPPGAAPAPGIGGAGGAPAAVGPGRRTAAWGIDFALVVVLAVALGSWTWTRTTELITNVPALAQESAWQVLTSRGDVKGASVDFGLSLWNTATSYVVQAFAALVLIVFVYHFAALAWKGRTVGKLVLDLRVQPHRRARLGKGQALLRAGAATLTDIGLYALACCLLLEGLFVLSVLCWAIAVAVFWANALPLLFPGRRTLHDRMAGTHVARAHLYRAAAAQAVHGGQRAVQGARQGAQRLAENERLQRLRESDPAQRMQGLGRDAAGKATETSRKALDKAKRTYADRRSERGERSGATPPPAIAAPQPPSYPYAPPQEQPYAQPHPPSQWPSHPRIPRPEEQ